MQPRPVPTAGTSASAAYRPRGTSRPKRATRAYAVAQRVGLAKKDVLSNLRRDMADIGTDSPTTLEGYSSKFRLSLRKHYGGGHYRSAYNNYYWSSLECNTLPQPITIAKLEGWTVHYVRVQVNSSGSLSNIISNLKSYCYHHDITFPVWTPMARKMWTDGIARSAPAPPPRKAPALTPKDMHLIYSCLFPHGHASSLVTTKALIMWATISLPATLGLRMCEILNDQLTLGEMTVIAQSVVPHGGLLCNKILSKTSKKSTEAITTRMACTLGDPPIIGPFLILKARLGERFPARSEADVPVAPDWGNLAKPLSHSKWVAEFRRVLSAAGVLSPASFSGHSLRATARTRLSSHGISKDMAQQMLGWTSDTSEEYIRLSATERTRLDFQARCQALIRLSS